LEPVELRRRDVDGDKRSSLVVEHLDQAPSFTSNKKKGKGEKALGPMQVAILSVLEKADDWMGPKEIVDAVLADNPHIGAGSKNPGESIKATIRKMLGRTDLGGELRRDRSGKYPVYTFDTELMRALMGVKMTKTRLEINPNSNPNYPNYYSVRVEPKSAANPRQPELGVEGVWNPPTPVRVRCGRQFGWGIFSLSEFGQTTTI